LRLGIVSQQGGKAAGAEHALMEFVRRLPASVEVCWFFFEDGDFAESIRTKYRSVTIVNMSDRVACVKRHALSVTAVADAAGLVYRLRQALRSALLDVVLTNSMKAHIVGSLAAKFANIPCVNYVHDIVDGSALALLRLISGTCSDERLACSQAAKRQLNLPRTSVVYAAIEVERFEQLPDRFDAREALDIPNDGAAVIGLVGRVARWKGQDQFIRIARRLANEVDAYFCIVGSPLFGVDDGYFHELEQMVVLAGLSERVRFVPWQQDMRTVYAALDVSCNCSKREPFGRTSLEALASGVPIVCFDDAGICEIFDQGSGGTWVPAGDEAAFSAAIRKYLRDPAIMATAGEEARKAAQPLDTRFSYPQFERIICRVGFRERGSGTDANRTLQDESERYPIGLVR
jgi:glycosyltransferase involved in cell wall biosynthesis